jgi:hypothetical protein
MYSLNEVSQHVRIKEFKARSHTITIDSAMGTWLLAVTLDLFPPAFVASSGDPPPLLQRRRSAQWL